MPQLGLHSHQSAAQNRRNLSLHDACEELRAQCGQRKFRCAGCSQAFARCRQAAEHRRRIPAEKKQGDGRRWAGTHHGGGKSRRDQGRQVRGRVFRETYHRGDRGAPASTARPRARRKASLDLFRGHGTAGRSEVAAGRRIGRHRDRVCFLLSHHGGGGDGGRDSRTDSAGGGQGNRRPCKEAADQERHEDHDRRQSRCSKEERSIRYGDHRGSRVQTRDHR